MDINDSSNKFKEKKVNDIQYSNFLLDEMSRSKVINLKNLNDENKKILVLNSNSNPSKNINMSCNNKEIKEFEYNILKKDERKMKTKKVSPPKHQMNDTNKKNDDLNSFMMYLIYTDSSDKKYVIRCKLILNLNTNEFIEKKDFADDFSSFKFDIFKIPDQILCLKLFVLNINQLVGGNIYNNGFINNSNSNGNDFFNKSDSQVKTERIIAIFSCHNSQNNDKYVILFDITESIELKCKELINKSILNLNFLKMVKINDSIDDFHENKYIYLISGISSNVTRFFTLNAKFENIEGSIYEITLKETTKAFLDLIFNNGKISKDEKCESKTNSLCNAGINKNYFSYNLSNNILLVGYHKNYLITYIFNKDNKKYTVRTWLD